MAIRGYVKNILEDKHCLFVSLSRDISARVIFTDLKKKREEKVEDLYPVGKLVSGRIKSYVLSFTCFIFYLEVILLIPTIVLKLLALTNAFFPRATEWILRDHS